MRTTHVAKAQKDQRNCEVCGEPITKGMAYKWVKPRYGGKRVRHETCRDWRASELTSSKMAGVYAAQEAFGDLSPSSIEDVSDAVHTAGEEVRNVAEEYRESAQNIEDGFQHPTFMSDELNEKADELESWADELEGFEVDEGQLTCRDCAESEEDGPHHEFAETHAKLYEDCKVEEADHHEYEPDLQEAIDQGSELVDACPV